MDTSGKTVGNIKWTGLFFRQNTLEVGEILGLAIFGIFFVMKGFGLYDGQKIFLLGMLLSIGLLFLKCIGDTFSLPEIVLWSGWIILAIINYSISDDKGVLLCLCMIMASKRCRLERICKVGILAFGGTGLINLFLSMLSVHEGTVVLHNKLGGEILRYAFGQPHPNVLHTTYVILCCFILFVMRNNQHWIKLNLILLLGSFGFFFYTISYTGILMSICLLGAAIVYLLHKRSLWFDWIAAYGVLIGVIFFSVGMPLIANLQSDFCQGFIQSVRHRFVLLNRYFDEFHITLLGQKISGILWYQLDTSWAVLLLSGGVLLFCSFVLVYCIGLYILLKQDRLLELYIVLILLLGGMMDPFLFNTSMKNIGLIFMASAIYDYFSNRSGKVICFNRLLNQWMTKEIHLFEPRVNPKHYSWKQLGVMLGIAIIVSIGMMQVVKMPTKYCVSSMDALGERGFVVEPVMLTSELLQDEDVEIFGNCEQNTEVYLVDSDRIRSIEYYRTFFGVGVVVFFIQMVFYNLFSFGLKRTV